VHKENAMRFVNTRFNWTSKELSNACPVSEYRLFEPSELTFLPDRLNKKISKAIVAHCVSGDLNVYTCILYRNDKNNGQNVIDEHPYIYIHNKVSNASCQGLIEHAKYPTRTHILTVSSASVKPGNTPIDIIFPNNPPNKSGSLEDLNKLGRSEGITYSFKFAYNKAKSINIIDSDS